MYKRLLRSALALAFSTAVIFGAVSAAAGANPAADGGQAVQATGQDTGWGFSAAGNDTGWGVAPAEATGNDTGWGVAPAVVTGNDTGWGVSPAAGSPHAAS
ncbi:hypothetical protein GCM10010358_30700 [Streptomyces minutiscleroticus]|uniref:Secreted protein n=1 Tax=Streptomyces minutiscleroticus TaxID=68238 RepID=A0A918KSL5_9ACTN|nr:hypothetical protein GCM10010358_30700 [Streptomyces minutiscleroticus]